ncbi:MAG: hypothetical protein QHJ82_09405 [Verrucomicrobiota bacterium]|nr:hypothetical protein [Verrucomicrobiota bacterium]
MSTTKRQPGNLAGLNACMCLGHWPVRFPGRVRSGGEVSWLGGEAAEFGFAIGPETNTIVAIP